MKAVFVVFNQANTERIEYMFDYLQVRGFTWWDMVMGRGTNTGDPHMATHTWPEMNSAAMAIVEDEKVAEILEIVKKIDEINEEVGIRAFVWNIENQY